MRAEWILARGDVAAYEGRPVQPADNAFVSEDRLTPTFAAQRTPLRAQNGKAPTQLAYARSGIVTPEMEFVAIRENQRRAAATSTCRSIPR